ncbi:MAG: hypothetical protein O2971_12555 [Proteobacteria bacterium]|nr:hypothetical protein [Pseudomonadota bacterium]
MSRWKAFAIHFSISLAVFLVLLAVILLVWYPGILFSIDGGWTGLRIVIGVDLVLGPLLTLIVFKAGKPGLKFDLSCIVIAQIGCMAAGMWIVYTERPIALILAYDTIYSVASQDFAEFGKDPLLLEDYPGPYPKLVYTQLPENEIQADIVSIRSQFIGDPLYIQTDRYRPLPKSESEVIAAFRREAAVRSTLSEDLIDRLQDSCRLAKFISSITSGYVCYDSGARSLREFFGNQYVRNTDAVEED